MRGDGFGARTWLASLDYRRGTSILPSQLATLEPLESGEDGVTIEVDVPPDEVVERALRELGEGGRGERDRG